MIPKVLKAFYGATWIVTEDKLRDIDFIVAARAEGVTFTKEEIRAAMGQDGGKEHPVRMVGSVAVVPVYGVLSKRMNMMTEISGGTSSDQLKSQIDRLAADRSVSAIVLDIHSPGGEVFGIEESARAVREATQKKKVVAVANDLMASGAYWLAAGASQIVTTPTAAIGSIGVYRIHRSQQGADEKAGIKTTIIRSSNLKGMGTPYLDLNDTEHQALQANVMDTFEMFVDVVRKGRRMSAEQVAAVATGDVWNGPVAVRLGLADRVASLDDVLAELSAEHPHQEKRSNFIMAEPTIQAEGAGTNAATLPSSPSPAPVPTVPATSQTHTQTTVVQAVNADDIARGERARILAITETCKAIWGSDPSKVDAISREFIDAGYSIEKAQAEATKKIIAERKSIPLVTGPTYQPGRIDAGPAETEKFGAVAVDALSLKMGVSLPQAATGVDVQRQREVLRLRQKSVVELAKESLRIAGDDLATLDMMSSEEIAKRALSWEVNGLPRMARPSARVLSYGPFAADGSFQTTGDFPSILKDAANKTLRAGYMSAPGSWRRWVRIAEGAKDLKPINRVILSAFPTAEIIPEDTEYPKAKLSDAIATYGIQKYGLGWSMTWEMMVNDDTDAFGYRGRMMGRAIENTINRSVYQLVTGNPTLGDGTALFHADHNNLLASGNGAPSHTQLAKMRKLLRLQTGPQSTADGRTNVQILGLNLAKIIVPASHETEALLVTTSQAVVDTASATNEDSSRPARNSGSMNQFRNLDVIVESILDGSSSSYWYGVADQMEAQSVEISFLNGNQTPFVEEWYKPETKGRELTVDLVWGAAVIDHRGICRNNGAAGV